MGEPGIVIVTWNSAATVEACLASIPAGVRVVVVDNGSLDDTVARVRACRSDALVVPLPDNRGFGAACNRGARELGDRDILLLNPDAALQGGTIEALAARLAMEGGIGVVGPHIADAEGGLELSWGSDPTLATEWLRKREHARQPAALSLYPVRVDWVTGACCLVRRSAWEAVGGFDERYFLYFEDLDLCRRIRAAGWSVWFEPAAHATHLRGRSAEALGELKAERYRASQLRYYRTHAGPLQLGALRLYLVLKYVGAILRRPREAAVYARIVRHAVLGRASSSQLATTPDRMAD